MRYFTGVLFLLLMLAGCAPEATPSGAGMGDAPVAESPPLLSETAVAQGEAVYAVHCAECHGANLEGEADWKTPNADGSFKSPPHNESGHTWHHDDATLLEAIRLGGERLPAELGSSNMPAFGEVLTEEEITAVLAYIKSTWPEDVRQMQWDATQARRDS